MLLSLIQQRVAAGEYMVNAHTWQKHGLEGFTFLDVENAVLSGEIISRRDDEFRCLICGQSNDIPPHTRFLGSFLHCVLQWDAINMVVVVTAYRPAIERWETPYRRLSGADAEEGVSL